MDTHRSGVFRGYLAMLVVELPYRKLKLGVRPSPRTLGDGHGQFLHHKTPQHLVSCKAKATVPLSAGSWRPAAA